MVGKSHFERAHRAFIIGSLALGFGVSVPQPSQAESCGAYCKARQVRAICHDLVEGKGITGHQRYIEFDKCKADQLTRRQIDAATENSAEILE